MYSLFYLHYQKTVPLHRDDKLNKEGNIPWRNTILETDQSHKNRSVTILNISYMHQIPWDLSVYKDQFILGSKMGVHIICKITIVYLKNDTKKKRLCL